MNRWFIIAFAAAVLAMLMPGAQQAVEAQPPTIEVREVRGQPVVVNGRLLKLYVFVFPERQGRPNSGTPSYCTDSDQIATVPRFANANPHGLAFNINRNSIPIDKDAATAAISASFAAWDSVDLSNAYFTVNPTGGASGPAVDGNNTVGWVGLVPKQVLAAAWVWTDESDTVTEADIFFNSLHKWGVFTSCNQQDRYEVGNVGTHEIGHVVGLDHLSAECGCATMHPTAAKGEVRKRTLTTGDRSGYTAAGGY